MPNLILTAAEIYIELGEKEKFKDLISQAVEKDPNNANTYFYRAIVVSNLGRYAEVVDDLVKSIEIDPSNKGANAHRNFSNYF